MLYHPKVKFAYQIQTWNQHHPAQHHAPPNTTSVQNGWPESLLELFQIAQNETSGSLNAFYGPFTTMFKMLCFPEDKFIIAPEVPQFSTAPVEVCSRLQPINLVTQVLTAKGLLVPVLVAQIRESETDVSLEINLD